MKIDRLIGILSILLQKEMTTAPELADHFEVSRMPLNFAGGFDSITIRREAIRKGRLSLII